MNQCAYPKKLTWNIFPKVSTNYFPEYSSYFGKALRFLKYIYGMNNSGKLLAGDLAEWLINESGFKQS